MNELNKIYEINEQNMLETLKMKIRNFENTKYQGYLFFINYKGSHFDSFDENPGVRSVKSEFKKILKYNGINIFKGVQQAGRTDKDVNARENVLYVNSKNNIEISRFKNKLNKFKTEYFEIMNIKNTLPFLEFPDMIEKRYYVYEYPENLIKNNEEKIYKFCKELSGKKDFKQFTSKKGEKLKNHIRDIKIKYENGKLYFEGDGFLHHQVRIMSNYILNNKMAPLDGKYLTLDKIKFKKELENYIFEEVEDIKIEKVNKIEKNDFIYIFYVNKKHKSEVIGKKGKNIKQLKKLYGNIIVQEEE